MLNKWISMMGGKSPPSEYKLQIIIYRENQVEQLFCFKDNLERQLIVFLSKYYHVVFLLIHFKNRAKTRKK